MAARLRKRKAKESAGVSIAPTEWSRFLDTSSIKYHGWLTQLETQDLETCERVFSQEVPLESIELDLEDERNPRINVTVHNGNKVIKHILFRPSNLVLSSDHNHGVSLQVETLNTKTTVRFREPFGD